MGNMGLSMECEHFAKTIKQLRNEHHYTLTDLARILEIKTSRISMWESNGTVPRWQELIKVAQFFNVSIDFLLGNISNQATSLDSSQL